MHERPAEVNKWLKEPLKAREIKRIMSTDRNELTYKELIIKDRIKNEQGNGLHKYYAPKGARVPHPNLKESTKQGFLNGAKGY